MSTVAVGHAPPNSIAWEWETRDLEKDVGNLRSGCTTLLFAFPSSASPPDLPATAVAAADGAVTPSKVSVVDGFPDPTS